MRRLHGPASDWRLPEGAGEPLVMTSSAVAPAGSGVAAGPHHASFSDQGQGE
jgi:hypothetical protein